MNAFFILLAKNEKMMSKSLTLSALFCYRH